MRAGIAMLALVFVSAPALAEEFPSTCVSCHAEEEDVELSAPVEEWREGVHAAAEVSCDACHGGDPSEEDEELSMDEENAGYLGSPGWQDVPEFCGVCHEDIQEAHGQGALGQKIARGERAAVCSTCHDSHAVQHPVPREILTEERCGECAEFADLVGDMEEGFSRAQGSLDDLRSTIDTSTVDRQVKELRRDAVLTVHSYERPRIEAVAELARERLEGVDAATRELEAEARFRRRTGLAVSGVLLLLCVGVNRLNGSGGKAEAERR